MHARLLPFGLVGVAAAAVHYGVALSIVTLFDLPPQFGNVGGYVVALLVSYWGQSRWTFKHVDRKRHSFVRFACTSLAGFLMNFMLYAALLRWTAIDYRVALLLVIGSVAALTYLLFNVWVFRPKASS